MAPGKDSDPGPQPRILDSRANLSGAVADAGGFLNGTNRFLLPNNTGIRAHHRMKTTGNAVSGRRDSARVTILAASKPIVITCDAAAGQWKQYQHGQPMHRFAGSAPPGHP